MHQMLKFVLLLAKCSEVDRCVFTLLSPPHSTANCLESLSVILYVVFSWV